MMEALLKELERTREELIWTRAILHEIREDALLQEMRKDVFIQARGVEFGERSFAMIYWLCEMSETARKEGLLSLEEAAKDVPPEIGLYKEIQWINSLVVDCIDPDEIIDAAIAHYWMGNFQGEDALMYYMAVLAFLMIQAGEEVDSIRRLLLRYLPQDAIERYEDYSQRMNASKLAEKRESLFRYDPVFEDQELLSVKKQLEEKIMQADDKMIQRWLREVEAGYDVVVALHGLSPEAKQKVLSNISENMVDMLVEGWEEAFPIAHSDLMEVLGKMLLIFEDVQKKLAEK